MTPAARARLLVRTLFDLTGPRLEEVTTDWLRWEWRVAWHPGGWWEG